MVFICSWVLFIYIDVILIVLNIFNLVFEINIKFKNTKVGNKNVELNMWQRCHQCFQHESYHNPCSFIRIWQLLSFLQKNRQSSGKLLIRVHIYIKYK